MHSRPENEENSTPKEEQAQELDDLERCPRCGFRIATIRWGQTDCPNCGLHFECC